MNRIIIVSFLLVLYLSSCLEPYELDIANYEDLLVVDALITDEVKNHRIYLTRSKSNLNEKLKVESGALVTIKDEKGNEEALTEIDPGIYETDYTQFVPKVGSTYVLHIQTAAGQVYQSKPCKILPKSNIDSVYYEKGIGWNNQVDEEYWGLDIFVNGNMFEGGYVRWLYEENWKFQVPYPNRIEYNYTTGKWDYLEPKNIVCWKEKYSSDIIVSSFKNQEVANINHKKICFIPTNYSDRLTFRYSILVKQISVSKEEYEYLNKLKNSSDEAADISAKQPSSIVGNIKNINNEKEPVLGYFQTGSVDSKRLYINKEDVVDLGLPIYDTNSGCNLTTLTITEYPQSTVLDLYEKEVINGDKALYDLYYFNGLAGIIVSEPFCSDCTVTGNPQKPDFWED